MDKVISLNERRAYVFGTSKLWSPLDALKKLVVEIESGVIEPESLIILGWDKKDANSIFIQEAAGLTYEQAISLLSLAKHNMLRDWS